MKVGIIGAGTIKNRIVAKRHKQNCRYTEEQIRKSKNKQPGSLRDHEKHNPGNH